MVNWGKDGVKGKRLSFWSEEDRRQNAREISKTTSTAGRTVDHINLVLLAKTEDVGDEWLKFQMAL